MTSGISPAKLLRELPFFFQKKKQAFDENKFHFQTSAINCTNHNSQSQEEIVLWLICAQSRL